MGDGPSGPSTMKYHYFHGRFTYSVKRSGRSSGWDLSRSPSAASRLILALKREPSRWRLVGEAEFFSGFFSSAKGFFTELRSR